MERVWSCATADTEMMDLRWGTETSFARTAAKSKPEKAAIATALVALWVFSFAGSNRPKKTLMSR